MDPRDPRFRLSKGQQALTPEQADEADRFALERISAYRSTEPVDEAVAETLLHSAYVATGIVPPRHVHWLDGPLELVAALTSEQDLVFVDDVYRERIPYCVQDDLLLDAEEIGFLRRDTPNCVDWRVRQMVYPARRKISTAFFPRGMEGVQRDIEMRVGFRIVEPVRRNIGDRIWRAVGDAAGSPISPWVRESIWGISDNSIWHSVAAYDLGMTFAEMLFFDTYFAPDLANALARFNERVSGYWLGQALALVVRRPRVLALDEDGRLHSASGPAVEYRDGWGFWAWHGVQVAEQVIRAPEALTRDDFFGEENVETRRVIQERMGGRFVEEIGARFMHADARGVLYEVDLPGDPDRVAHYVQVRDASTAREYYLPVPPTTQTAAEAVAWTFGLAAHEYDPSQET